MSKNTTLAAQTVQETMLLPLWGRAKYSHLYPELLNDPQSSAIIEQIEHDFSQIERTFGEYGGLAYLVRAYNFDNALKAYLAAHPQATVVNIGAGLDTTFSRVDNGRIRWCNLDMPDSIAFRTQFIPETERSTCIARSVFDYSWFDEVEFEQEKGIFFLAGGLFMYFQESEVRDLFTAMAHRFPGGEIVFDAVSSIGLAMVNRRLKKTGTPIMHFRLDNPSKDISRWSENLEAVNVHSFWYGIPRDPRWSWQTRLMINLADLIKSGRYVQLRFRE